MEKISITLNVGQISKNKIVDRKYTDKEGKEVVIKELKLDIVPLREPKHIKNGDGWQMWKTHFVSEQQTDEEKKNQIKSKIIGDGIVFKKVEAEKKEDTVEYPEDEVNPDDIPF